MIPSTPGIVGIALTICSFVSTLSSNNIKYQIVLISQSKTGYENYLFEDYPLKAFIVG